CLQRRVGERAANGADLPLRGIEDREGGVEDRPLPEGVEAAPVEVGPVVLHVRLLRLVPRRELPPEIARLIGLHARSAGRPVPVQQPADGQRIVAHQLRLEPETRATGEEAVVGVRGMRDTRYEIRDASGRMAGALWAGGSGGGEGGGLLVGGAGDHEAEDGFDGPGLWGSMGSMGSGWDGRSGTSHTSLTSHTPHTATD